jgi:hypothetical protein
MNWSRTATVQVDLSGVLKTGDKFTISEVRALGVSILSGTYDGKPIALPVAGEFAAFVLRRLVAP